ncbi:MAG: SDR family oxidoreductase [Chloroflexi bacterium]|nr:SDR family oxidoreductase [Chloroflexota bacterium]
MESSNHLMARKTYLVTGGTTGIGLATARTLARMGANVILVGHDTARGQAAAAEVRSQPGSANVDFIQADLSSQAQVRQLAAEIDRRYPRLDVLINNAGAIFLTHKVSSDGIEMTFALNHLNYFLLTNLLLEKLKSSAPARIVNVSSAAHLRSQIDFDNLQGEKGYSGARAYGQSKLANLLFTYELAQRLNGDGITVNALHPGFVASNFGTTNPAPIRWAIRLGQFAAVKPEEGAQSSVYLASSPEVAGVTGKYFYKCKPISSSQASYDKDSARRLWEVSAKLTGLDGASVDA